MPLPTLVLIFEGLALWRPVRAQLKNPPGPNGIEETKNGTFGNGTGNDTEANGTGAPLSASISEHNE